MRNRHRLGIEVLTLFMLIILFPMTSIMAEEPKVSPVIVIPEKVFDFKDVKEGTVLEHTFKVYNKGDGVLTIKSVKPG